MIFKFKAFPIVIFNVLITRKGFELFLHLVERCLSLDLGKSLD